MDLEMPDIIPTGQSFHCQVLRFDADSRLRMIPRVEPDCMLFGKPVPTLRRRGPPGPDHALLAQRPGHEIFGPAVARLALAARDEHFRRAFLRGVGVEARAFLKTLALAELVGARLAVRRAVGGHQTRRA